MAYKRQIDRLPIIPADAKEHNVTCHYCIVGCGYKAYTWPTQQAGRHRSGPEQVRRRPRQAAGGRDRRLVRAVDVQHRQAERQRRSYRHQARQGLRREFRPRLDPRRAHGRDELFARSATPSCSASPTRWSGATARCSRPAGTTRSISSRASPSAVINEQGEDGLFVSGLRPRRRRRRLREHLGHRQALFRRHEGQEHPHPQPPGLQFRSPCHARHGRRRTEQLLRGRRACRHHRRRSAPTRSKPRPTIS